MQKLQWKIKLTEMQLQISNFEGIPTPMLCQATRKVRHRVNKLIRDREKEL